MCFCVKKTDKNHERVAPFLRWFLNLHDHRAIIFKPMPSLLFWKDLSLLHGTTTATVNGNDLATMVASMWQKTLLL